MKSSLITRVVTTTAFALGAFALAAVAGTWTPPTTTPPNGNVDAPINVGATAQIKVGSLTINSGLADSIGLSIGNAIKIVDGTQGLGKVLVSDSTGKASWWATSTLGIGSSGGSSSYSRVLLDAPTILSNPGGEIEFHTYAMYSAGSEGGLKTVNAPDASGTIQAGTTTGIPANAKGVLLYGQWDCNSCNFKWIRFKQPSQTNWKRLVFSNDSGYDSNNSAWIPLDSSGRLQWEITGDGTATGIRLEIQGYEIY